MFVVTGEMCWFKYHLYWVLIVSKVEMAMIDSVDQKL